MLCAVHLFHTMSNGTNSEQQSVLVSFMYTLFLESWIYLVLLTFKGINLLGGIYLLGFVTNFRVGCIYLLGFVTNVWWDEVGW